MQLEEEGYLIKNVGRKQLRNKKVLLSRSFSRLKGN